MRVMASDVEALDGAQALRDRVIRKIRDHEAGLRALGGVTKLWLFGSLARGDARPNSDVDVLIDIVSGRKFLSIGLTISSKRSRESRRRPPGRSFEDCRAVAQNALRCRWGSAMSVSP
jgi:Nucleotidyltransferase domain